MRCASEGTLPPNIDKACSAERIRREVLMAARSLIDHVLERMERPRGS